MEDYSEILNLVAQAGKDGIINPNDKKTIKEFIINNEPNLSKEMDEYNNDKDLNKLMETLKVMCGIEEISSPEGKRLMEAKRKRGHKKKNCELNLQAC